MSRTDKTRPWTVKCLDDPSWLEEQHRHEGKGCDLPPRPTRTLNPGYYSGLGGGCFWWPSAEFWHLRANACGCALCTDRVARRAQRRRSRHGARLEARAEVAALRAFGHGGSTVVDDLSDVDVFAALGDPDEGLHREVAFYDALRRGLGLPDTHRVVDLDVSSADLPVEVLDNEGNRFVTQVDRDTATQCALDSNMFLMWSLLRADPRERSR